MRIVVSLVLGVLLGLVGAVVQTYTVSLGSLSLPLGALAALIAITAVSRACAWWSWARWGAIAFSTGWLGSTLMMGTTTPGGDLILSAGTRQVGYLVLGSMLLAATCGYPLLPEDEPPRIPSAGESVDA